MNRKRKPVVETPPSLSSGPVSSPSSAPDIAFSVTPCSSNNFQSTSAKKLKSVVPYISNDNDSPDVDNSVDDSPDVDNSVDDSPDVDNSVDDSPVDNRVDDSESDFSYIFFDTGILLTLLNDIVCCKKCGHRTKTIHELSRKQGFAHYFLISCSNNNCDWTRSFCTSTNLLKDTRGRPAFDVNVRSLLAFREIGKGHSNE